MKKQDVYTSHLEWSNKTFFSWTHNEKLFNYERANIDRKRLPTFFGSLRPWPLWVIIIINLIKMISYWLIQYSTQCFIFFRQRHTHLSVIWNGYLWVFNIYLFILIDTRVLKSRDYSAIHVPITEIMFINSHEAEVWRSNWCELRRNNRTVMCQTKSMEIFIRN